MAALSPSVKAAASCRSGGRCAGGVAVSEDLNQYCVVFTPGGWSGCAGGSASARNLNTIDVVAMVPGHVKCADLFCDDGCGGGIRALFESYRMAIGDRKIRRTVR
jgi:hypothetical protein